MRAFVPLICISFVPIAVFLDIHAVQNPVNRCGDDCHPIHTLGHYVIRPTFNLMMQCYDTLIGPVLFQFGVVLNQFPFTTLLSIMFGLQLAELYV